MTVRGGTRADTITHTLTFSRSHTPFGCAAVSTWPMTGPLLTGHSHEGRVCGWTGYSTTSRHGRTELRWEVPGPFITLVVWGPGASLLPSLCLCLHQINGLGTTEEVFQSAPPAKTVHHSDNLLFIMALIQGHTLTCTDVCAFNSCWFEVKLGFWWLCHQATSCWSKCSFYPSLLPCWRMEPVARLPQLPGRYRSWILNDPFWMKWMKHNWLSVSGTSVPKLRLELRLQGGKQRTKERSLPSGACPRAARIHLPLSTTERLPPPGSICSEKYLTTGQIQLTGHAHTSRR